VATQRGRYQSAPGFFQRNQLPRPRPQWSGRRTARGTVGR